VADMCLKGEINHESTGAAERTRGGSRKVNGTNQEYKATSDPLLERGSGHGNFYGTPPGEKNDHYALRTKAKTS